jgi:anaerobic magnesium-protoporphyrin IX monomethyl ester cyclase
MYGRNFRVFPIERVLADLDDMYYRKKIRFVFIADDNMVLNPQRVIELCDAIIARGYRNLNLSVQADCRTIAANEEMVRKMGQAGFKFIFLGIENTSADNLKLINKENTIAQTDRALEHCRRYGIFVIAGLIVGLPDDDDDSIRRMYEYFLTLYSGIPPYIQIITPYPKTRLRQELMEAGLITNDSLV